MTDEPLITLGVRKCEEYTDAWEVYVELNGETHYDSEEVANEAMAEYLASMGPSIMEPSRCILIPRPERHISTIKIAENSHMVKFCVPCKIYTTIAVCPCCGVPTLGSARLPGVEDAGVRARREAQERYSRAALKPEHGTVTETPDGPIVDVDARFVENPEECRRCSECVDLPHHWEVDYAEGDDEEEGDAEVVWGCKHCDLQFPRHTDLAIVDYALHTQAAPEMVLAGSLGRFVEHLADWDILVQLQMPDRSWHSVKEVKPYNGPSHVLFLWDTGFCRRHTCELIAWRPIFAPCDCSSPDGPCDGCNDPHGHTCRSCDEEWCQACWLLARHAETCPAASRD